MAAFGLAQRRRRESGGRHRERVAVPDANSAESALVIVGGWSTLSVKLWIASGATPLAAVIMSVRAAGARVWRTGEGRRAVAVVHERHPHRAMHRSRSAPMSATQWSSP